MGLGEHRAAPRSDRVPKQPLNHSFTFSTPENPRHEPGRKRARTLEYPPDAAALQDEAKVKGGHSLRKRVRIDYAQMNDDNEDDQARTHAHAQAHTHAHAGKELPDDRTEITVSGARGARKRRSIFDPHNEDEAPQAPPTSVTKRARSEKQRTVSPKPQRRRTQQRKSISAPAPRPSESPDQQPSDTELKDTIEVGAPLTMQFSTSSSSQLSETASNVSAQSPSQNRVAQPSTITGTRVASPTAMEHEDIVSTDPDQKEEPSLSTFDGAVQSEPEAPALPAADEPSQQDVEEKEAKETKEVKEEKKEIDDPAPTPPALSQQLDPAASAVPEIEKPQIAAQSSQDPDSAAFAATEMAATSTQEQEQEQGHKAASSQESIDSDATQDMPPDGQLGNAAVASELGDTISSVVDEQPSEQPTQVPEIDNQKESAAESLQNDQEEEQEVSLPRTRVSCFFLEDDE
jgi:hypothetical protein